MQSVRIELERGRLRKKPRVLYDYTKYNTPLNRFCLDKRRIRSQMPEASTKKRVGGRPRLFVWQGMAGDRDSSHG
jgi:hypothetical protein